VQGAKGTQKTKTQVTPASFADTYGKLSWPLNGTVLRRFGKQKDPLSGESIQSNGIDIQAPRGSRVTSVYDGVVALAKFIDTYGQTVVINHGRYSTVYAHLSGLNVQQGQRIQAGTTVGMVGNSGITDAQNTNWLSFEIRYNKTPQDPLRWLKP
jgi:septal ring factor EnvC (AmiA/AmiB activator)